MARAKIELGGNVNMATVETRRRTPGFEDYDEAGVDLSLLRHTLRLAPLDRLLLMEAHARDTLRLYEYGRQHRETKTGAVR